MRGDLLTLGLLAGLTAGAAARGRRGGRNLTPQDGADLEFIQTAYFPDVQRLNELQISAMQRGEFRFEDGEIPEGASLFYFSRLPFHRDLEVKPDLMPTLRGPRPTKHFEISFSPPEREDFYEKEVWSAVLELDDGEQFWRYFLPGSQFDLHMRPR